MVVAEHYNRGRHVLTELSLDLTPEQAATPVPACPGWTVKDVYAHLAGVAADMLAGNLEGVATPPWTAKHVADRADRSLSEIVLEWSQTGPRVDEALRAIGDVGTERIVSDIWSHEQDVRGALSKPGSRDVPRLSFAVDHGLKRFSADWPDHLPTVEVTSESGRWVLGTGEPEVRLATSDYEIGRALIGRRSRTQYLALDWTPAEPDVVGPIVDHLHVFPMPESDLEE
jgi:uncharacterized protein (TIGR03083 family)